MLTYRMHPQQYDIQRLRAEFETFEKIKGFTLYDNAHQSALLMFFSLTEPIEELSYTQSVIRELGPEVDSARYLKLRPNDGLHFHKDPNTRAALAIITNPDCYTFFETQKDKPLHTPADGRFCILNTRIPHACFNGGIEDRVHLVIHFKTSWKDFFLDDESCSIHPR